MRQGHIIIIVLIYSKLHSKSCDCLYKLAIWYLNWQVERPRIEKKPVTSEHPVIKRKKKKYKDPDNLCKMPVHDLTVLHFACIFILQQINIDCGMFNSFTVEISPEHPDTEWYEGEWSLQFLVPLKHSRVSIQACIFLAVYIHYCLSSAKNCKNHLP